jgi:dihydrofolate reductase
MIVASTENGVIGREGGLPWKLKDDMRHFVKTTLGKKVLMGRKTFESILKAIGKPLTGRENYVLTRDQNFQYPGVKVFHEIQEVINEIHGLSNILPNSLPNSSPNSSPNSLSDLDSSELVIAGGAEIYAQFLPLANKIYLTKIKINLEGDAFFPSLDSAVWEKKSSQDFFANAENQYDFEIMELHKKFK